MFRRGKLNFLSTKDDRIKIINDRINITEKHLIEMCCSFATCTGKLAKYRDSYDELAKSFKNYADDEEINETLSDGLKSFTNAATILGDYMDIQVHRMEVKLVNELASFENLCKSTRENLRAAVIARDREVLKQRQMLELKSKFAANNSAADSELLKAKLEVNRTNKEIDKIINNFEQRKLSDIKTILTDFVLISMKFHTKALEALSASYYDVSNIDEHCDFMEFQKLMKTKDYSKGSKLSLKKGGDAARSQSMESLDRDQLLSPVRRLNRVSRSTKNLSARSDDELDGECEDEEDDDDEEEADSEENSNADEDDSGSASDDDDDEEEAANDGNEAKSTAKTDLKKIKSKFQAKPASKSTTLATHVYKTKLNHNQTRKPFAAKSGGGVGIPTAQAKRNSVQFEQDLAETGCGGRLVTVVESKKPKKHSVDYGNEVAEVINCTRGGGRNLK